MAKAIGFLGLEDLAWRFLDELSGSQRQRAFVAMVLCQDTDNLGKTIVLVLHDTNFASCYSDYIVAMRDGSVAHHGRPEEVMKSEIIRDVYDMDVDIQDVGGRKISIYYTWASCRKVSRFPRDALASGT